MEMAERERIHYDQEQQGILNSIVVSQSELEDLAQELEVAKRERTHKIQYDELALELGKFPSREASQASIAALETEIQELEWESRQQDLAMTQRKQQFDMALQSLVTMQESIQQEQLDVVKRQFLKRTTQEDEDALDDEEEGFVETQGENGSAQTAESTTAKAATPAADGQQEQQESDEQQPPSADGLERVLSMEGHHRHSSSSDRSRRGGSESPRDLDSPNMSVIVSESPGGGGDVFVVDLQNHSTLTPTNLSVMEQASTPMSPSGSQKSAPKPVDSSASRGI